MISDQSKELEIVSTMATVFHPQTYRLHVPNEYIWANLAETTAPVVANT